MWSTRIVARIWLLPDPFIPVVAVAVKGSLAMAINAHLVASKDERRGVILIANLDRIFQPVVDICAPLEIRFCQHIIVCRRYVDQEKESFSA